MSDTSPLVLYNGDLRTQDPRLPRARAVAMANGRILATGDDDTVRSLAGPRARCLDLEGRLVLPGFMDSHIHYYDWALARRRLLLADVKSFGEAMERLRRFASDTEEGEWVLGQGWNEAEWPENRMPLRADLDRAAPRHPAILWRCDMHLAVVNSRALELAGIGESTPDPPEGEIQRDDSGRPTGVLRESAINVVKPVIPPLSEEQVLDVMRSGIPALHALGITSIHDVRLMGAMEWPLTFRAWQALDERGELDLRCWAAIPAERLDEAAATGLRTGFGNSRLRAGHVKFYADGGMGARSAWMIEPYLDGGTGMPLVSVESLRESVEKAHRAGLAVMIHAIGDRANRETISVFEEVLGREASPLASPPLCHRMEHVQMIRPEDLKRLAALDVAASVQPANMVLDIRMIDECVGPKGRWTYPFRDLLDAGVPVLFSSDAPVCDANPLVSIHAAVTRRRPDGSPPGGWYPDQKVSVEEAVRACTLTPASTYGVGSELGSLSPGKRADLAVFDRNLYTIPPQEILEARVDLTVFDGEIRYERGS